MAVDTKTVQGRRKLVFRSFDEVLADAEKLVASPHTRTLGNWPLSQLLMHLAMAMNRSIDGITFKAPWFIRIFGGRMKRRIFKEGLSPGLKLPKEREAGAFPAAASPAAALETLRQAVVRCKREKMTSAHPVFGKLTHDEWVKIHLRHAEMHLSFALPA